MYIRATLKTKLTSTRIVRSVSSQMKKPALKCLFDIFPESLHILYGLHDQTELIIPYSQICPSPLPVIQTKGSSPHLFMQARDKGIILSLYEIKIRGKCQLLKALLLIFF